MKPADIFLADDHELFRKGIRALLEDHQNWRIVGEASNGREAVEKIVKLKPDIAILDVGMPEMNGLEATRQIMALLPSTRVLILTMHESEQLVREVLSAGARGYVLKSDPGTSLISAIQALLDNKSFLASSLSDVVVETYLKQKEPAPLTKGVLTTRGT